MTKEDEMGLRHSVSIFFAKQFPGKDYCEKSCPLHCGEEKDGKKCYEKVVAWYKYLIEGNENQ